MYPTISVAYIISKEEALLKESYQSISIIADEFVFLINRYCTNTINLLRQFQIGDDRIKIYFTGFDNPIEQKKQLLNYCTKEFIFFIEPCEVISDNCVLLRQIMQDNPEAEAYTIKTNYFIYNFCTADNTPLKNLPFLRIVKNRDDLLIINNQINGFLEPIFETNEIYINNYQFLKDTLENFFEHTKEIDPNERIKLFSSYLNGTYPLSVFDINKHPQYIKDKIGI